MEKIKINSKQRFRLYEMCIHYFGEKLNIEIPEDLELDDGLLKISNIDKKNKAIKIHWFEFCMTHLFYEIYWDGWREENCNCAIDFQLDLHNYFYFQEDKLSEKYHPIDLLYKVFYSMYYDKEGKFQTVN